MKTQFPGFFSLAPERIKRLWNSGLFVFDANILLGLYRYSDATRNEFFAVLKLIKDRCWLPHQSVKEYFENRLSVIGKQEEAYSDIIKSMNDIESKFKSVHQHPFLSSQILDRICRDFEDARSELESSKAFHTTRILKDDVLLEIEKVFRNGVGLPYLDDQLSAILNEGEERYKKNIPPGFRDGKKDDTPDASRKYGDLILWKQMLTKAASDKLGVIFVCDDRKEDWWLQFKGKTIGPRPELIKEFFDSAGTDFHMYSSDRFLEYAGGHFDRGDSKVAVSEMREIKRFDEEKRKRNAAVHFKFGELSERVSRVEREKMELANELKSIEMERSLLEHTRQLMDRNIKSQDPRALSETDFERLRMFVDRFADMDQKASYLRERIIDFDLELKEAKMSLELMRLKKEDFMQK